MLFFLTFIGWLRKRRVSAWVLLIHTQKALEGEIILSRAFCLSLSKVVAM